VLPVTTTARFEGNEGPPFPPLEGDEEKEEEEKEDDDDDEAPGRGPASVPSSPRPCLSAAPLVSFLVTFLVSFLMSVKLFTC